MISLRRKNETGAAKYQDITTPAYSLTAPRHCRVCPSSSHPTSAERGRSDLFWIRKVFSYSMARNWENKPTHSAESACMQITLDTFAARLGWQLRIRFNRGHVLWFLIRSEERRVGKECRS